MQVAVVADDLDDLRAKLQQARSGEPDPRRGVFIAPTPATAAATAGPDRRPNIDGPLGDGHRGDGPLGDGPLDDPRGDGTTAGSVAFLYPGQGSQRPGMLADLFVAFPNLQRWLRSGAPWADRMFPAAAFSDEARAKQREALTDTRVAQPALGIAGLAMTELLASCGLRPDVAGGHSYGELVALAVAAQHGLNFEFAELQFLAALAGDGVNLFFA